MRELERETPEIPARSRLTIVGRGRLGTALAAALRESGYSVDGPHGRGWATAATEPDCSDVVLLCVPDGEIEDAAAAVTAGPLVGHCSGATGLGALDPHEGFSLHPLMTVTPAGAVFSGAGAAVAGTTDRALDTAVELALALRMRPVSVADEDRAAYHAAASIASNFLVTLEAVAERLAATAGVERAALVPLVRASVENWAELGASRALTGPVARGDVATVARQREAVSQRADELLPLFDALVDATRVLAGGDVPADAKAMTVRPETPADAKAMTVRPETPADAKAMTARPETPAATEVAA